MSKFEWYDIDITDKGMRISIKAENIKEWSWYWLFQSIYLIFFYFQTKNWFPNPTALLILF